MDVMPNGAEPSPGGENIGAALDRVLAAPTFRHAPQLAAFLRFVVEETLAGQSERIKGYTIATEALGRGPDFDPQSDPIVRVEAGRLRRALARYYAGEGRDDDIVIELAPGSYVPTFRRAARPGAATIGAFVRRHARGAALVLSGAAVYALIELAFDFDAPLQAERQAAAAVELAARPTAVRPRSVNIGPAIYVEPVVVSGTLAPPTISAGSLRNRLIDAFARFEDVAIVANPPRIADGGAAHAADRPSAAPDYELAAAISYNEDGTFGLMFRLVDAAFGAVVWSKSYEGLRVKDDPRTVKYPIVGDVTMTLLQPFGIVQSYERSKRYAGRTQHLHYRCLLDAFEYLRSFNPAYHADVRDCLEKAVAADPSFSSGYVLLSRVFLREYQFDAGGRPALDRALAAALRAVDLKPSSARALWTLQDIRIARGEIDVGLEAGRKSVALNPYDRPVLFNYGAHLILLGRVDEGLAVIARLPADNTMLPARLDFILFVAAYLKGDMTKAAHHANLVNNEKFPFGHFARALVAAQAGDGVRARQAIDRLVAINAAWRDDPRGQLKKFFLAPHVLDRFAADLGEAARSVTH
jgi:hypothetical protein